jgi:uncharacterized protein with HEPN domain
VTERDLYLILDALDHLEIMGQHIAQGSLEQLVVRDAVCLRLSVAIEVLNRLDGSLRDQLFGDTWPKMWATRNRIAHAYNLVSFGVIAQAIELDIPPLIASLNSAVETLAPTATDGPDNNKQPAT